MESSGDQLAKVKTSDGGELMVPLKVLKVNGYFKDFLEDQEQVNEDLDISDFSIITKEIMEHIVEFSALVVKNKPPEI